MANPYGPRILELVFQVANVPTLRTHLFEYMPLYSTRAMNLPLPTYVGLAVFTGVVIWMLVVNYKQIPLWQHVTAALFLFLELNERRHLGVSSFVLAALAVPHLKPLEAVFRQRMVVSVAALLMSGGILWAKASGAMGVGPGLLRTGIDTAILPKNAVEYFKVNRPPDNLFNSYGPGGYLLYFLGPETKVFMDGRFFVFDISVWDDLLAIEDGRMTIDAACEKYGFQTFFIYIKEDLANPNHLANRLTVHPEFRLMYFDDAYAVFVRDAPATRDYLAEREFRHLSPFAANRALNALGDLSTRAEVLREVERTMRISQESGTAIALAVYVHRHVGDTPRARELLDRGLELHPRNRVLQRMHAELTPQKQGN